MRGRARAGKAGRSYHRQRQPPARRPERRAEERCGLPVARAAVAAMWHSETARLRVSRGLPDAPGQSAGIEDGSCRPADAVTSCAEAVGGGAEKSPSGLKWTSPLAAQPGRSQVERGAWESRLVHQPHRHPFETWAAGSAASVSKLPGGATMSSPSTPAHRRSDTCANNPPSSVSTCARSRRMSATGTSVAATAR